MEEIKLELLDLMLQPAFAVEGKTITKVNPAAAQLLIREGDSLDQLLVTGQAEYEALREGSLYVTLDIFDTYWGACVTHTTQGTIFLLDRLSENSALQMLALAARELRSPLSEAMIAARKLANHEDPKLQDAASRLNQKLFQILRLVSNMSDASMPGSSNLSLYRMDALFREFFEKTAAYTAEAGFPLLFEGLDEEVSSLADRQELERAILNLVSNAMKFSPKGSPIRCRLTRHDSFLHLQVINQGDGIPASILPTVFQRHLRQPTIEDGRFGIGLGLLLVRSAASNHGGAVLIDQPEPGTTRVTVTMAIRPATPRLNCPILIDYAGELDHTLLELSDCLPPSSYQKL